MTNSSQTISKILKHESKRNTYKIALVRAINDIALEYPLLSHNADGVAIPLRLIAEFWLAYYWAFAESQHPILQGHDKPDMTFREELTDFRRNWESSGGNNHPSEGFNVKKILDNKYPALVEQYKTTITSIQKGVGQPIKFSGTGEYNLFHKPEKLSDLSGVIAIPTAKKDDVCFVVDMKLWKTFIENSAWIEEQCLDEWCLFTEKVHQPNQQIQTYTETYRLLTAHLSKP